MKLLFNILLFSTLLTNFSTASEINYYNKSWADIVAKAKAEHKYIFVDCYTDWCGWCKVMDKETMTDQSIITMMTDKFVAVKMDMEKGEGITLAMKYHISSFPTFMFFNPDGVFVYQAVGYKKTDEFTMELNNAMDKSKQFSAPGYSSSVTVDFPEFYKKIFGITGKRERPNEEVVTSFLDQQKDLYSEISWGVISQCRLNEKYTNFFLEHADKYSKLYGKNGVENKISSMMNSKLQQAIKDKSEDGLIAVLKMADKYITDDAEGTKINFRISYYQSTKDWNKCVAVFEEYIAKNGYKNTGYFNSVSWSLYENCEDKKLLNKACGWMEKVVKEEPQYAYLDTYAAVLYKTGKLKEAESIANKAIEEGKKSGTDVSGTEGLLKKIKG